MNLETTPTAVKIVPEKESKKKKSIKVHEQADGQKIVTILNRELRDQLRSNLDMEELYQETASIPMDDLFIRLETIRRISARTKPALFEELIAEITNAKASIIERVDNMLKAGNISFYSLQHLFPIGSEIAIYLHNIMGGRIIETSYKDTFSGVVFKIKFEYISSKGNKFDYIRSSFSIPTWNGTKNIKELSIQPINDEVKAELTERGSRYVSYTSKSSFVNYTGKMEIKTWNSWNPIRAVGRAMMDASAYDNFGSGRDYWSDSNDDTHVDHIDPSEYWLCDPYAYGFSFATKQWGRFSVDDILDISWKEDAFDKLVLDDTKKKLIKALVKNSTGTFQDIIEGKGGGCIFLLHGAPGTGKTLTAEAIAELLHRPLYSITVGELGVDTETLENNLRKVLDLAQTWNAVLLIDEADIFLEKRTSGDILRNAMVGIFLRLLEYHQGVLFLTTNRVTEFDEAFHSRISIALKYRSHVEQTRYSIWQNLLQAAGVEGLDIEALAKHDLNGRQIKSTIRLAQSLATDEGIPVNISHIMACVNISAQFLKDLKDAEEAN